MQKIYARNNGAIALVSDEDYIHVYDIAWYQDHWGYMTVRERVPELRKNRALFLHIEILKRMGYENVYYGDHKDQNKLNCQRGNLRPADRGENRTNAKLNNNNKSGYRRVYFSPKENKWYASICIDRGNKFLGFFHSPEAAARAYNEAAIEYLGEFAVLNEIKEPNEL